jgi:hypothetical protein
MINSKDIIFKDDGEVVTAIVKIHVGYKKELEEKKTPKELRNICRRTIMSRIYGELVELERRNHYLLQEIFAGQNENFHTKLMRLLQIDPICGSLIDEEEVQ